MNQPYEKPKLMPSAISFFKRIKGLEYPEYLADNHPHILNRLYLIWGNPSEVRDYLNSLTLMDKSQQGFPLPAFKEIMYMQEFHDHLYP